MTTDSPRPIDDEGAVASFSQPLSHAALPTQGTQIASALHGLGLLSQTAPETEPFPSQASTVPERPALDTASDHIADGPSLHDDFLTQQQQSLSQPSDLSGRSFMQLPHRHVPSGATTMFETGPTSPLSSTSKMPRRSSLGSPGSPVSHLPHLSSASSSAVTTSTSTMVTPPRPPQSNAPYFQPPPPSTGKKRKQWQEEEEEADQDNAMDDDTLGPSRLGSPSYTQGAASARDMEENKDVDLMPSASKRARNLEGFTSPKAQRLKSPSRTFGHHPPDEFHLPDAEMLASTPRTKVALVDSQARRIAPLAQRRFGSQKKCAFQTVPETEVLDAFSEPSRPSAEGQDAHMATEATPSSRVSFSAPFENVQAAQAEAQQLLWSTASTLNLGPKRRNDTLQFLSDVLSARYDDLVAKSDVSKWAHLSIWVVEKLQEAEAARSSVPAVASCVTISQLSSSYGHSLAIFMQDLRSFIDKASMSADDRLYLLNCVSDVTNLMACFEHAYQAYTAAWSAIMTFEPALLKGAVITQAEDDYQLSVYESLWKLFASFIFSECSRKDHHPEKFLIILVQMMLFMSSQVSVAIWRHPRDMFGGNQNTTMPAVADMDPQGWEQLQASLESKLYNDYKVIVHREDIERIRGAIDHWFRGSKIFVCDRLEENWKPWPRRIGSFDTGVAHLNENKKKIAWHYEELVRTKGFGLDVKVLFLLGRFSVTGSGYAKHHTPRRMLPYSPARAAATPNTVARNTQLAARLKEASARPTVRGTPMVLKNQRRYPLTKAEENSQMRMNMERFFATKIHQGGPGEQTQFLLNEVPDLETKLQVYLQQLPGMAERLIKETQHQERLVYICLHLMEVRVCHEKEKDTPAELVIKDVLLNPKWYACAMVYSLEVMRHHAASDIEMASLAEALERMQSSAIDMLVALEGADRFEYAVGFALQRSMRTMFEKMIEKDVWHSASPLYLILQRECQAFGSVRSLDFAIAEEQQKRPLPTTDTHLPGQDLRSFWRKLLNLVRCRTDMLASALRICHQRILIIKYIIYRAIEMEVRHKLLENRHLDLIIVCAIFAVQRAGGSSLTFNDIHQQYKRLPQYEGLETLWEVKLANGETKDVRGYFNDYFSVVLKDQIYAAVHDKDGCVTQLRGQPRLMELKRTHLPASTFVPCLMTPRARVLKANEKTPMTVAASRMAFQALASKDGNIMMPPPGEPVKPPERKQGQVRTLGGNTRTRSRSNAALQPPSSLPTTR